MPFRPNISALTSQEGLIKHLFLSQNACFVSSPAGTWYCIAHINGHKYILASWLNNTNMNSPGQVILGQSCIPSSFVYPTIFGTDFTNLEANLVTNYSFKVPPNRANSHTGWNVRGLTFCNVSLEYTHTGYNDIINTQVWLPVEDWNGRLQGAGGGGFKTGLFEFSQAGAVGDGYAAVSTNGGHSAHDIDVVDASSWALTSPGNINWVLLQDFASVSLDETAAIGKSITKDFYGRPPTKSYWNGCSTGGRQGLMLAQRYPTAYDGILAAAPAINWGKFLVAELWPQIVMNMAREYPPACELDAITATAIEACDALDGVKDGIISSPELCTFDAKTTIDKEIHCASTGKSTKISELAAQVANTAWQGARSPDGKFLWYGLNHDTPLTGLAGTVCTSQGCTGNPFIIPVQWLTYFLKRDPTYDWKTLTLAEAATLLHASDQQFKSILSTDDPDLTEFKRAGGKMLTWHGLTDTVIFPNGSRAYYEAVAALDPDVKEYYRLFEAPGVEHCYGGPGPYPEGIFERLVEWVENGRAPETIYAKSHPDEDGLVYERELCAYPARAVYKGIGDAHKAESYGCI